VKLGPFTVIVAGSTATVAFDFFGQSLAPMIGLPALSPIGLANQLISTLFGQAYKPGAELLHYLTGIIVYPIGWIAVAEPVARKVSFLPWPVAAILYGVVLWVFALYILGHLIVGNPPFLGFNTFAWVALAGHVIYALVAAAVVRCR